MVGKFRTLCRETAQSSADPIGEIASANFSPGAALASGMVEKVKNSGTPVFFGSGKEDR